ncbi:hypothetical protein Pelo_6126 [Pelomyxa schiedti]|nr:hypothetical protein Pelo_6126 [Pelomyxa schiedti]
MGGVLVTAVASVGGVIGGLAAVIMKAALLVVSAVARIVFYFIYNAARCAMWVLQKLYGILFFWVPAVAKAVGKGIIEVGLFCQDNYPSLLESCKEIWSKIVEFFSNILEESPSFLKTTVKHLQSFFKFAGMTLSSRTKKIYLSILFYCWNLPFVGTVFFTLFLVGGAFIYIHFRGASTQIPRGDRFPHDSSEPGSPGSSPHSREPRTATTRHAPMDPDEEKCIVCLEEKRTITLGCGHFKYCESCSNLLTECAYCRAPITVRVRMYSTT